MLYIVTALYEEALPFLRRYHLKRITDFPHFDVFAGEGTCLLITRPGALRAAAALSSLLTAFPPGKQDFLLSIGCAGCAQQELVGQAFLLCRITEGASGRTRYPELLYRCPFPEAEVITQAAVQQKMPDSEKQNAFEIDGNGVVNFSYPYREVPASGRTASPVHERLSGILPAPTSKAPDLITSLPLLYDMEAAGIYEAAIPYFSCDRLLFIKVVSDALTGLMELPEASRRAQVTNGMEGIMPKLTAWLDRLIPVHGSPRTEDRIVPLPSQPKPPRPDASALGESGELLFTKICDALHLSTASSHRLYQLMLYLTLSEISYQESMQELLATPLAAPCRTKKEGLKYLEQLSEYYL